MKHQKKKHLQLLANKIAEENPYCRSVKEHKNKISKKEKRKVGFKMKDNPV